ncbi:MAG: hypothetical protein JXB34_01360 [Bacteroidales bacterium]|nr:hypothetical protein [Bacteroidales bacterium]
MKPLNKKKVIVLSSSMLVIFAIIIIIFYNSSDKKIFLDFNNDGKIGISDVTQVSSKIGQKCHKCPEDLNNDQIIDSEDLSIIMFEYQKQIH